VEANKKGRLLTESYQSLVGNGDNCAKKRRRQRTPPNAREYWKSICGVRLDCRPAGTMVKVPHLSFSADEVIPRHNKCVTR